MCIFRAPQPQPMPTPPPIMPRTNASVRSGPLPGKKELVDEDDPSSVEFGSEKKVTAEAGKKTGTQALKIPLQGASGAAATRGANK